jgi:Tfp pilus assembly major pilin PilA
VTDYDKIWIGQNGQKYGPYTEANVRQWMAEGKLARGALAWRDGMAEWVPLSTLFSGPDTSQPPPLSSTGDPGDVPPPPLSEAHAPSTQGPFSASSDFSGPDPIERASLPTPPSLHWGLVLLFAILTFGIFAIVWTFIQANWVRKIDPRSNATLLLVLSLIAFVVGYSLDLATLADGPGARPTLGPVLVLTSTILSLVAYFRMAGSMRRGLSAYGLRPNISGATLFFFTLWYLQGQMSWLARWKLTGQTSPRAPKGIYWALCVVPFVIAILAAISVPAYQDYIIRTQVSEGVALADGAKTAVTEYYARNGTFPPNNPAAGLAQSAEISGKYVSGIDVSDGKITVAYDTARSASAIRNQLFVFAPVVAGGFIRWDCSSGGTIPAKYLPTDCRK